MRYVPLLGILIGILVGVLVAISSSNKPTIQTVYITDGKYSKVIVDSLSIWNTRISNGNNIHMPIGKAYLVATDGIVTDTLNFLFEDQK